MVLDCANGAPSLITPYLLERLGCQVGLNAHPDGNFPGRNPEPVPEKLTRLIAHQNSPFAGFPRRRRRPAIAIKENGERPW